MRLENILALTHGELVSSPFVNKFENIVFEARHVKRGDLFIAYNEQTIEEAIFNGAYGVIFSRPTQIIDTEIAWIKVLDLDDALRRILRFMLIDKEIRVYSCSEIILKLALQVVTEPSFLVLNGNEREVFTQLQNVTQGSVVLFCPALLSADIFTEVVPIPKSIGNKIQIIEQTLFETSFIYENTFYERQQISPFFMPYLEQLLHLFKVLNINFRLRKFTPIDHFEAFFINKKFEIKEFGTSDMVLIFEKKLDLIQEEILFLQKEAAWAHTLFVIPQKSYMTLPENIQNSAVLLVYENESEIKKLLQQKRFHFALIAGVDSSILNKTFCEEKKRTLFDFA
jgi:ferrochelatase